MLVEDEPKIVRRPPGAIIRSPPPRRRKVQTTDGRTAAFDYLRLKAGLVYTTDPEGLTIPQIHQLEEFSHIPIDTLRNWSRLDNWGPRRKEIFDRWRREAEDRLGGEIARVRLEELRELQDCRRIALLRLKTETLEIKSLEGLLKALVVVGERIEALAKTVGDAHGTRPDEGGVASEVKIALTDQELEAAIDAVLQTRIEQSGQG